MHTFNPHLDVLTTDVPFSDVTINNHKTDSSAPTQSSTTTSKPNNPTGPIKTSTTLSTSTNKKQPTKSTKPPTQSHTTSSTGSEMTDLNSDSTNKRTTTAAPNSTATKGYKLENSTDDDIHLTSIHPINVPVSTTEVSIIDVDTIFDPIIDRLQPVDVTFRPLVPITDTLIPNPSMVDTLLIENGTISWQPFENVTVLCHMNRDCAPDEICIHGQCKGWCGPMRQDNCFSGI